MAGTSASRLPRENNRGVKVRDEVGAIPASSMCRRYIRGNVRRNRVRSGEPAGGINRRSAKRAPVPGVPFSADATTILHAILGDGTRLDQTTTDRYYRDSTGRVRIERHMEGLAAPKTLAVRHFRTLIAPDPNRWPGVYTVDAEAGTVRLNPRSLISNTEGGGRSFDVPVGGVRFLSFFRAGDLLSADPGAFGDVRDEPLGMTRSASRGNRTTDHDHRPARLPWQRSVDRNGGRTLGIG